MKRTTSRLVAALIATSTVFGISRANARTVPNLERCTQWSVKDGVVGFVNECDQSVDVLFMPLDRPVPIEREVAKGERFSTGLSQSQRDSIGWMSTRCPVGYRPTVPFKLKNQKVIFASRYNCAPRSPRARNLAEILRGFTARNRSWGRPPINH